MESAVDVDVDADLDADVVFKDPAPKNIIDGDKQSWIFKYHVRVRVHVNCRFHCCQENIDL